MPQDGGASLVAEKQPQPFAFHTGPEAAPFVELDLGKTVTATGLFIRNAEASPQRMATLAASVSVDGQTWTPVWKADKAEKTWEVPLSEFVSGARIPGKKVRFIRLEIKAGTPDCLLLKQVEVYGKE